MKILNLEEFRKLPAGTVFMKYEPCVFEDLQVKGETWESDFLSENITYWPKVKKGYDFSDMYDIAEVRSIALNFDCLGRDGCLDKEQLFAVYDRKDMEMLLEKLGICLKTAY